MKRRRGFTLIELLVVIAIISVLIGLLLPAVQRAREAAARIKCANNLKQIGLAMIHYEANEGRLPPTRTGYASQTWAVTILPYLEQRSLYKTWDFTKTYYEQSDAARRGNVPIYFCPSRRTPSSGPSTAGDSPSWLDEVAHTPGALSDYAVVIDRKGADRKRNETTEEAAKFNPPRPVNSDPFAWLPVLDGGPSQSDPYGGPPVITLTFTPIGGGSGATGPPPPPPDPLDLITTSGAFERGRGTTYASFRRGTSQLLFVGEKQVPAGKEGIGGWDCSIYNGDFIHCSTRSASRQLPLTVDPKDMGWKFGSRHIAVVQFCFADGHVQGLPVTIDPRVLELLSIPDHDEVIPDY